MSAEPTWRMPAETEPHERTWMAWPSGGYTLGDTAAEADEARRTWAAVARAVSGFEPVAMVVDPGDVDVARHWLGGDGPDVELVVAPLDDAWMRDVGPTFVVSPEGHLGAVDWTFNGWGGQSWASWEHDAKVGLVVADHVGAAHVPSTLVNEGGGLHVDGLGTALLTRTVQLDPGRNPGWDEARVEAEVLRTTGAHHVVWLDRGLTRDDEEYGTRGHVDLVATIAAPHLLLVHDQPDPAHPDHDVTRALHRSLAEAVDATGTPFELATLPAPRGLRDAEGWVDHSYVNHYVVNGGVVACAFDDPRDDWARGVLADAYPGRDVVTVDARPLFARGGGVHCITQQQPAVGPAEV